MNDDYLLNAYVRPFARRTWAKNTVSPSKFLGKHRGAAVSMRLLSDFSYLLEFRRWSDEQAFAVALRRPASFLRVEAVASTPALAAKALWAKVQGPEGEPVRADRRVVDEVEEMLLRLEGAWLGPD